MENSANLHCNQLDIKNAHTTTSMYVHYMIMSVSAMDGSGLWTDFGYPGSVLEDNTTSATDLICRQEQGSPLPLSITTANILRCIQVVYYLMCFLVAVLLNTFVIMIVIRFKQLHNLTFYFSLQIIIVDLTNTVIIFPHAAANAIADKFIFNGLCNTLGFFISFFRFARNTLMFVLVVDRFCAIFLPFWYNKHRSKAITLLSVAAWTLTMIFILITASLGCYQFQRFTWSCSLGIGCKNTTICTAYTTLFIAVVNVMAFISFLFYLALLYKAKKHRNRIVPSQLGDNDNAEAREIERRRAKSERRANTTFFILFTAIMGVTFPTYLTAIFGDATLYILEATPPTAYTIILVLLRATPNLITILDPIVIMRNQDVREVIQTIMAKLRKRRREERLHVAALSSSDASPSDQLELTIQKN